ncbi:MoxR family ATPase [Amycolatopsis sp. MtRt-6]|uniref:AAA family ATPase n=1 Tax=Amycolatopsis sp. MtRt-6 TaxID=2792782 RepID=UPI001A905259|nr:MoxR family ATPase [Amycolatopsis sp. MtRt-6]
MTGPGLWQLYRGDGVPRAMTMSEAPPWRRFKGTVVRERTIPELEPAAWFQTTPEMVDAVNAALHLRRPLLVTGRPGSGKSTLIESVASELRLGEVLRWHITSSSTLREALYSYDALGRLQEFQVTGSAPDIGSYLRLGPLGTALLPTATPRALLVDEIDKSDVDLPSDLLNVFERGEFQIPELARLGQDSVDIQEDGGDERFPITDGKVTCLQFPFVVLTSNGERDFPPAFLRRCIQFRMPDPDPLLLRRIVVAHLGEGVAEAAEALIEDFSERAGANHAQATDQLLNAIFVVTKTTPVPEERERIVRMLLKELESDLL